MKQNETPEKNTSAKKRGFKWDIVLIALAALLFVAGGVMILREYVLLPNSSYVAPPTPPPATPSPLPTQSLSPSATPIVTPSPTPYVKPIPTKISFVEQKQACAVFPSNVDEHNRMEVIERNDAASWLEIGPAPGEAGNAVIAGHRSLNKVAGTFQALWDMEEGDAVVIEFADGRQQWFYVGTINTYPFDDVPAEVMDPGGPDRLTLITCVGEWNRKAGTSSERFIVVCFPGEVVPAPTSAN